MMTLPDVEARAVFATEVETDAFPRAAQAV